MASYEYHCGACGHDFAIQEKLSEHGRRKPACPRCRSSRVERLFTPVYAKTVRKS